MFENIEEWEHDYNVNYPYKIEIYNSLEDVVVDNYTFSDEQMALNMVKLLKNKYNDFNILLSKYNQNTQTWENYNKG